MVHQRGKKNIDLTKTLTFMIKTMRYNKLRLDDPLSPLLLLIYDPQIYPIAVNSTSISGGTNSGNHNVFDILELC